MMISHKYKFIFFRVHKTASTSLQFALSNISGPEDIISEFVDKLIDNRIYSKNNWYDKERRPIFWNHIHACMVKEILEEYNINIWDDYFKFCFERNPWDKAISLFYFENRMKPDTLTRKHLNKFIMHKGGALANWSEWKIYTDRERENVIVDKVFKYEEMDESIKYLINRCNLPKDFSLPDLKYKSQFRKDYRHYRDILTNNERKRIESIFKKEIRELDYRW